MCEYPVPSVAIFHMVRILGGVICPIFLVVAIAVYAVVANFITNGQLDFRTSFQYYLPAVNFMSGLDEEPEDVIRDTIPTLYFWVIADHFFIFARHGYSDMAKTIKNFADHTPATWLLTSIIVFAVIFAFQYFINTTIVLDKTVMIPFTTDKCSGYTCYADYYYGVKIIDCQNPVTYANLTHFHCFRFMTVNNQNSQSFLTSIGIAFSLYFAAVGLFQLCASFAALLHHLWASDIWGIPFIVLGIALLIVAITSYFLPILGNVHSSEVDTFQVILLAVYIIIIGILLLLGSVQDVILAPNETKSLLLNVQDRSQNTNFIGRGLRYKPAFRGYRENN